MTAHRIFRALQEFDGQGQMDAARAGFMEWALGLPLDSNAQFEARRALVSLDALPEGSAAGQLFLAFLRDASRPAPEPMRRGGRKRVLH